MTIADGPHWRSSLKLCYLHIEANFYKQLVKTNHSCKLETVRVPSTALWYTTFHQPPVWIIIFNTLKAIWQIICKPGNFCSNYSQHAHTASVTNSDSSESDVLCKSRKQHMHTVSYPELKQWHPHAATSSCLWLIAKPLSLGVALIDLSSSPLMSHCLWLVWSSLYPGIDGTSTPFTYSLLHYGMPCNMWETIRHHKYYLIFIPVLSWSPRSCCQNRVEFERFLRVNQAFQFNLLCSVFHSSIHWIYINNVILFKCYTNGMAM